MIGGVFHRLMYASVARGIRSNSKSYPAKFLSGSKLPASLTTKANLTASVQVDRTKTHLASTDKKTSDSLGKLSSAGLKKTEKYAVQTSLSSSTTTSNKDSIISTNLLKAQNFQKDRNFEALAKYCFDNPQESHQAIAKGQLEKSFGFNREMSSLLETKISEISKDPLLDDSAKLHKLQNLFKTQDQFLDKTNVFSLLSALRTLAQNTPTLQLECLHLAIDAASILPMKDAIEAEIIFKEVETVVDTKKLILSPIVGLKFYGLEQRTLLLQLDHHKNLTPKTEEDIEQNVRKIQGLESYLSSNETLLQSYSMTL